MKAHMIALSLGALVGAACGGKAKAAEPAGGDDDVMVPEGPLTPGAWDGMTPAQRGAFMRQTVLPTMAGLFVGFDAVEFADMDCQTCHGQGAEDGSYQMPNPGLKPLRGDQIMNPTAEHVAITEFMKNDVRPTMANLLGKPEWTPEQPDGFGCYGCHPPQ